MKMKDEKQKHNHKLTDLLKLCIFGLLMIAPLLASVSQMLYVTLNKNAKDSYYGETINQEITTYYNQTQLQEGKTYNLYIYTQVTNLTDNQYQGNLYVDNVKDLNNTNIDLSATNRILLFTRNQNYSSAYLYNGNTVVKEYTFLNADTTTLQFTLLENRSINTYLKDKDIFSITTYNKYSYLDNAFYYGVDQMTKSDLFNWTQNTAIYTGVKAMTDNLQIQTPAIAILIVYWFILTIIYVIIDIVLKCFTTITHMIFRAD